MQLQIVNVQQLAGRKMNEAIIHSLKGRTLIEEKTIHLFISICVSVCICLLLMYV